MIGMNKRRGAALAVVACGVGAWSGIALASGIGGHGITRTEDASVVVDGAIRIKEKSGSRVTVSHITVEPGGHTLWHYHPGPHIVSVRRGTVEVFETDCSSRVYPTGTGFYDEGPSNQRHVHTLRNPSATEPAEVVITDVRGDDPRLTVAAEPPPAPCFS